jgi:translation initiation factor IF-3
VFKERGEILLLKFAQALEDLAKVEQLPKLEGKRMFLLPRAQGGRPW